MSQFILLFRRRDGFANLDRFAQQKWTAWIKDLDARGLIANLGQPLDNAGQLIEAQGQSVRCTAFTDRSDTINGFIAVVADDLDEAVEISRFCPILEEGGSVEVRPVLQRRP